MAEKESDTILYNFSMSFFSKKAKMTLLEKGIPFTNHNVDFLKNEQNQPSFMKINPAGKVPVLVHNGKITPDSEAILEYVEEHFGDHGPTLIPRKSPEFERYQKLRKDLDDIRIDVISFTTLFPSDGIQGRIEHLRKMAKEHPDMAEVFRKKAEGREAFYKEITTPGEGEKELKKAKTVLDELESNLKEGEWVMGPDFTSLDINLAVLLQRLQYLDIGPQTWENEKHPKLKDFYQRVSSRDSFKQGCVSPQEKHMKEMTLKMKKAESTNL